MARKALCSIGTGPQETLLALARPTFESFARRHGYELHLHTRVPDSGRPASWNKIPVLRRLLAENDFVLWIDADAMIVDGRRDIVDEAEEGRFLYLVRHHYDDRDFPNAGVLLLRGGPEAEAFLDRLWNATEFIDHPWWENAAVLRELGYDLDLEAPPTASDVREQTKFLGVEWNSTSQDRAPRPRIRHYPGYKVRTRRVFMLRDLLLFRLRRAIGRA